MIGFLLSLIIGGAWLLMFVVMIPVGIRVAANIMEVSFGLTFLMVGAAILSILIAMAMMVVPV